MATVLEYVTANTPETVAVLEDKHAGTVALVIGRVAAELFDPALSVDIDNDLTERSKGYVADLVTLELISTAIDYYQVKSHLSEGLKGEGITYYDRIEGLEKLAKRIEGRLDRGAEYLRSDHSDLLATAVRVPGLPKVSTDGQARITDDPNLWEPTGQFEGA